MGLSNKNVGIMLSLLLAVFLSAITIHSFSVLATQCPAGEAPPSLASTSKSCLALAVGRCSPASFSDEFDGTELDLDKWDVFTGTPVVGGGWLTLSGADIQAKSVFRGGILQGVIQSSDWVSQSQLTDSSFGFEIWTGNNGKCHYGALFKASGHLAVLSPQPDANGDCSGDPLYQAYPPLSNWDAIRAGSTVSFTLHWYSDSVALEVSGNGQEEQAFYTGPAAPTVPLEIRLYAQPSETYMIDSIRLCACYAVYLPVVMRQY